jgi:hypothetical protein
MSTHTTVVDRMQDARVRAFLDLAGELAGSARGASRLLIGDDAEAFNGGADDWAALRAFHTAATEFASRALTHRQRQRAAAVLAFAVARLQTNLHGGQRVRCDAFVHAAPGVRAAADEFAEAVLAAVVTEHEEAKLPHFGALLANVLCHDETDRTLAMLLVRLTGTLSWRQLVLLALFSVGERLGVRATDYHADRRVPGPTVTALHESLDLERQGLLLQTNGVVANIRDLIPVGLVPMGVGQSLVKRLALNQIPGEAVEAVAELLR